MLNTQSSDSSIVPWIALIFSILSLIVSIVNFVKTHRDKKIYAVVENVSNLLSIFENLLSNNQWKLITKGDYISNNHRMYETNLTNILNDYSKDYSLKKKILSLRTKKPSDLNSLKQIKNEIENELKNWRGF